VQDFEINAVMLGEEWLMVMMAGEVFADYELWLDKTAPFRHTMACGLTNAYLGYSGNELMENCHPYRFHPGYQFSCTRPLSTIPTTRPLRACVFASGFTAGRAEAISCITPTVRKRSFPCG